MDASHIALRRTESKYLVNRVDTEPDQTTIEWSDGHQSVFHTIWLRDNCSCEACGDHSGGSRFFEINMIPDDLSNTITLADGMLKISWTADGHTSLFDPAWLRSHCNSDSERRLRRHHPTLWDETLNGNLTQIDYQRAREDPSELLRLYDAVRTYGICLLANAPPQPEATEEIARLIGFVRETHYGRVFEIISTPNPTLIANAPVPLRPHTDENFREPPPGIMIFHSIKASEDGGGLSVMTDGFKLAADYRALYPEDFELLCSVPIPHRRFIDNVGLRAQAPVIRLNDIGEICEFRLNERTMAPLDLPHKLIKPTYHALKKMFELSYQSKYHLRYLLKDGEALIFDNARVLHARTGFNGNRHVRLTHVGSDEFYSRWRQLRYNIKGDINLV